MVVVPSADLGGSEVIALDLARWMRENGMGCEVVFLSSNEGPASKRAEAFGLPIHTVDGSRSVIQLARLFRSRSTKHVLAFMFGAHLYVAIAARLAGATKMIAFVGNPASPDPVRRKRTKRRARLAQPFTSMVVACSHYVADSVSSAYALRPEKVHVIHNWVDVERIEERCRASGVEPDEVIGMIARLDPIKDHEALLEGFALVAARNPKATLRLAGDGPTRRPIEARLDRLGIRERVHLVGAIEDPIEELGRLTVFAFTTTEEEGFGLVLPEAMAAGVPIVATEVGPVAEVLEGGRGGRLVPAGDDAALAEALIETLEDDGSRAEMVLQARGLVRGRYSVERAGAKIREMLDVT